MILNDKCGGDQPLESTEKILIQCLVTIVTWSLSIWPSYLSKIGSLAPNEF